VKNEAERIAAITDPFESLREATTRMAEAQAEVAELARLRRRVQAAGMWRELIT
jgi:hypothetical protein